MYMVSLLLLRLSYVAICLSAVLATIVFWPLSLFVWALFIWRKWHNRGRYSDVLGSASFADERELRDAGLMRPYGFPIGEVTRFGKPSRFQLLSDRNCSVKERCELFFSGVSPSFPVFLSHAIHIAVVAPTGVGKGVSFVIPFLLWCRDSCVVLDYKGENARITAEYRARMFGHVIAFFDPYHVVTKESACFNPLDLIEEDDPCAIDHCFELAKAIVVRSHEERERHWNDMAEIVIGFAIGFVVAFAEAELRNLQTGREILTDPKKFDLALNEAMKSNAFGGMLKRKAGEIKYLEGKEKSSVMTTVSTHLRFLDTPTIAAITQKTTFDPRLFREGRLDIYMIIPLEYMRANSALIRLWIVSLFRFMVSGGIQDDYRVHFILDETASLGRFEPLEDALDKLRAYGIRIQMYFQSLGQAKKVFEDGQDQTMLSNTSQVYFGVHDLQTAEMISQRLGEHTIYLESGGASQNTSWQQRRDMGGTDVSYSTSTSNNWQLQARKLLKPEEVLGLHPRQAITFTPGVRPILTWLPRYYERVARPNVARRTLSATRMVVRSGLVLCAVSALMICLAVMASQRQRYTPATINSQRMHWIDRVQR